MTFSGTRPCCWTGTKRTRSSTVQAFPVWKSSSPHSGKRRFRRALMTGEASEPVWRRPRSDRWQALLPLLVQPGKVHVIAMDFGKRPGHEQFEALLEQRKIGPPIRLRKSPASPASRKHTESGSRISSACWHFGHSVGAFRPGRAKLRQEGADFGRGIGRHGFPRRLQWRSVLCCRILGRRPLLEEGKIVK